MTGTDAGARTDCDDCPLVVDRRRFLRDTGLAVLATLIATGLRPVEALAEAVGEIAPTRKIGTRLAYAVPSSNSVSVDAANDVIIARWENRAYAFSLKCPHRGATLEWKADESRIFCPKHKARFTPDGNHFSGRETTALDRYRVSQEGSEIIVKLDAVLKQNENPADWSAAVVQLA
jgi:nitrite reductase/ring-hydroxylating ferredoxin subunit